MAYSGTQTQPKRHDRFGNPINLGDVIAYYGTNVGLIVGVVVKFNPKSYKVKYLSGGKEYYAKVLYDYYPQIVTAEGIKKVDRLSILDSVEKLQLGL